jgi:hypothetical protein
MDPHLQPEVQTILTRVATVDPAKHLLLVVRRQTARPFVRSGYDRPAVRL